MVKLQALWSEPFVWRAMAILVMSLPTDAKCPIYTCCVHDAIRNMWKIERSILNLTTFMHLLVSLNIFWNFHIQCWYFQCGSTFTMHLNCSSELRMHYIVAEMWATEHKNRKFLQMPDKFKYWIPYMRKNLWSVQVRKFLLKYLLCYVSSEPVLCFQLSACERFDETTGEIDKMRVWWMCVCRWSSFIILSSSLITHHYYLNVL